MDRVSDDERCRASDDYGAEQVVRTTIMVRNGRVIDDEWLSRCDATAMMTVIAIDDGGWMDGRLGQRYGV